MQIEGHTLREEAYPRQHEGANCPPIAKLGVSSGIYFYQIWVNKELKYTDKLVIVK